VLALAGICLVPVLLAGAAFVTLLAGDAGSLPGRVPAGGHDGLWLGHAWVDGHRTPGDLDALAARLRQTGIKDVFVHVGPLSRDGSLSPALSPRSRWLLTALHHRLPGLRLQAWLGDLVGPGQLRLAQASTRRRILAAAAQVLAEGFDGVQYDLEPVPSGDRGYLALLAATHKLARARHAVLSVASDQVEPLPHLHTLQQWIGGRPHWWSAAYLRAVASRADEIALMSYDTGVPAAPAYSGYVRMQTLSALAAVPPSVTVLIGLPAYHTSEPGHTSGETVAAGVRGVRLGLGTRPPRRAIGVALYADFSATPADWAAYLAGWVRPHGQGPFRRPEPVDDQRGQQHCRGADRGTGHGIGEVVHA
jgi:ABC-type transporter Mla MlaB component